MSFKRKKKEVRIVIMNKLWKRIVAVVCTVTMVTGICMAGNPPTVNAENTAVQTEWSIMDEAEQWNTKRVLHNCDTNPNAEITTLTEVAGEFKEGTGAAKVATNANNRFQINTKWDLSSYSDGNGNGVGTLHLWFYLSSKEQLKNDYIAVALTDNTSFTNDTDACYWQVKTSDLTVGGWTELFLDLGNPTSLGTEFDWSAVKGIKIHLGTAANGNVTTIVDDLYLTANQPDRVLHNCDTTPDANNFSLTEEVADVKEGTGAVTRTDNGNNRFQAGMNRDLSNYSEGTLHFWLYVSDVNQLKKEYIVVDIASSLNAAGTAPQFSGDTVYEWQIPKSELTSGGWTEVFLDCTNPTTAGAGFNWSTVRGIKIHLGNDTANSAITTIVDDIRIQNAVYEKETSLTLSDTAVENYALYFMATIDSEEGVEALQNAVVEIGQDNKAGLKKPLNALTSQTWKKGDNLVRVDFSAMTKVAGVNSAEFDLSQPITYFRIQSGSNYGTRASVTFNTVDIADITPCVLKCYNAVAGQHPSLGNVPTGYVFAGWYQEATCENVYTSKTPGVAYAKFVDADIFNVVAQVSLLKEGQEDTARSIRFVTTVDSEDYAAVGFEVTFLGKTKLVGATDKNTYKKLYAVADITEVLTYEPCISFDRTSEFFKTYTIYNIPSTNYEESATVRAYWKTLDGTKVYGEPVTKSIAMGLP